MDSGASLYYFYAVVAATGVVVQTANQIEANKRREAILQQELQSNELAALDEENQRLRAIRYANDEMLAKSGGIEAWASPSLIAMREFNFKMGFEDIQNTRYNIMNERAGIAARIGILKKNSRATIQAGIFQVAQIGIGAKLGADALSKTTQPGLTTNAQIDKALGGGGANTTMGVGFTDLPGSTGVLS